IFFNDTLKSETTLSYEPSVSSLNDEIDFRVSFDDSYDEDYTVKMDYPNITMEEYIRLEEKKLVGVGPPGYGVLVFMSFWFLVKCRHEYAVSSCWIRRIEALDDAANKEEPVRRGPEAGAPGSTLRRSSQNTLTEDVLPWSGSANMAFGLWLTEDVLPWPGSANMAFGLRLTEDVLPWPGSANMAFDLVPDLICLLHQKYKEAGPQHNVSTKYVTEYEMIVRKLEAANPTKEPLKSPLLDGKWELIYTTSQSILQTKRPKFLRSRINYQAINADTLRAQNMESFPTFNQ
nr:hypothetical protein [Tanacetum cinerariifolium]